MSKKKPALLAGISIEHRDDGFVTVRPAVDLDGRGPMKPISFEFRVFVGVSASPAEIAETVKEKLETLYSGWRMPFGNDA